MPSVEIEPKPTEPNAASDAFAREAAGKSRSVPGELWGMLKANKKWWLLPAIVALLIVGLLVVAGSTGLAPFIYTLF